MLRAHDEISIVLGGSAGQGIQTVEALLMGVLKSQGYHVFATKEYMSRIRGGSNSTEIRVTSKKRSAYVRNIDILLPLDKGALPHLRKRITDETLVFADARLFPDHKAHRIIDIPFSRIAQELGNPLFANTVAVGAVLGFLKIDRHGLDEYLRKLFGRKGEEVVRKNIEAGEKGYKFGHHVAYVENMDLHLPKDAEIKNELLLGGVDALGMGVLAAGCNFISSYPMSPGTGLLTFLAQTGQKFGTAVEQVEDEISAINMALGASYAGARAIVTTSGGGFALMEEGVSLAGIIETPVVVHIAQRPGPATGLPTRTEQADLNLALYSGHGEFPRAIFAPGSHEEMFETAQQAFHIADKYQVPVFILTDQYLLDAVGTVAADDLNRLPIKHFVTKTKPDYRRYVLAAKDGVSLRGIPGYGEGLVVVDSDEHDEAGHLTEDLGLRVKMHEKRMKKAEGIRKEVLEPVKYGAKKAKKMVVGWGSTFGVIREALEKSGRKDISALHFRQVWPLPENVAEYFEGAEETVVIENNFTGQFANLLRLEGVNVTGNILKYDGEPFSVEELIGKTKNI
jgi:2-oxoglutarate ferredoxin oxidoreductase subunit alpha